MLLVRGSPPPPPSGSMWELHSTGLTLLYPYHLSPLSTCILYPYPPHLPGPLAALLTPVSSTCSLRRAWVWCWQLSPFGPCRFPLPLLLSSGYPASPLTPIYCTQILRPAQDQHWWIPGWLGRFCLLSAPAHIHPALHCFWIQLRWVCLTEVSFLL